ncbi:transglycosylase-like protein with SLT domain [Kushneria sinocarnis]|uniref:Transglycosylase-like protein with SLT domain n=1 Tax=Kushneria sinocarnis TaxID=595502 RepID=A0A420WYJ5_9GAMM|nr:lytic transglycosylase domain-containing protein [Kushneria sinocarnis]RKR06304.1 transglycosylase-like protein with SLT domain [Kushneria sinocarnis]
MAALLLLPVRGMAATMPPADIPRELLQTLKQTLASDHGFRDHYAAEVWLMDMQHRLSDFLPETQQRLKLLELLRRQAWRTQLDPQLILALIQVESRFDAEAVSTAGARGLMQVMPFWKREIGRPGDDLSDPATNLRYGCTILAWYLQDEHHDLTRALARYNGSLGRTDYPERVMQAWTSRWWLER